MTLKYEPWDEDPSFEWDEHNAAKIWAHGIEPFEVEQCFELENERVVIPHVKAKSEPEKYGDRYIIRGVTNGGRRLLITIQHVRGNIVRPITAWDL